MGSPGLPFQSTLPVRGATGVSAPGNPDLANFNPRSPCGERHNATDVRLRDAQISIHAPRAGSDALEVVAGAGAVQFQSTLPVRGATRKGTGQVVYCEFQSTLPVRGATVEPGPGRTCRMISIHAPRAGSDHARRRVSSAASGFQSTLPVRGATMAVFAAVRTVGFQSTLPVRGATPARCRTRRAPRYFNPRSPCGERHLSRSRDFGPNSFQSTLPVRGATEASEREFDEAHISIHAPRAGSDVPELHFSSFPSFDFNPRSPCGERRSCLTSTGATTNDFNPRSPCGERQAGGDGVQ